MEMHSVTSTAVEAIGWEDETMYVRYTSGATYAFHGVSFQAFEDVKDSSSIGRALGNIGVRGVAC